MAARVFSFVSEAFFRKNCLNLPTTPLFAISVPRRDMCASPAVLKGDPPFGDAGSDLVRSANRRLMSSMEPRLPTTVPRRDVISDVLASLRTSPLLARPPLLLLLLLLAAVVVVLVVLVVAEAFAGAVPGRGGRSMSSVEADSGRSPS